MDIDVATLNEVIRVLTDELMKYTPGSPEALALWKFKERLENNGVEQ